MRVLQVRPVSDTAASVSLFLTVLADLSTAGRKFGFLLVHTDGSDRHWRSAEALAVEPRVNRTHARGCTVHAWLAAQPALVAQYDYIWLSDEGARAPTPAAHPRPPRTHARRRSAARPQPARAS